MAVNIPMLILGILMVFIGIENVKGNIASIHWYNRRRITEETRPKYGKLMGVGTLIIAGGLIFSAILNMLVRMNVVVVISSAITLITVIVGILIMLYAQIKYNKGIF